MRIASLMVLETENIGRKRGSLKRHSKAHLKMEGVAEKSRTSVELKLEEFAG